MLIELEEAIDDIEYFWKLKHVILKLWEDLEF